MGMHADVCADMCAGMCADTHADMCAGMHAGMCADMRADMCADMHADMCADICVDEDPHGCASDMVVYAGLSLSAGLHRYARLSPSTSRCLYTVVTHVMHWPCACTCGMGVRMDK